MAPIIPYDREAAIAYAHQWAYSRNPSFYNYDDIGGDCTNFASQCLYAGTGVMNFTPTFGWYYIDANRKAPAWTGVPYFYNFMTRNEISPGPFGIEAALWHRSNQFRPAFAWGFRPISVYQRPVRPHPYHCRNGEPTHPGKYPDCRPYL